MTIPDFTTINATGKIDCMCNLDFKMNVELIITPKSVSMTCQHCGKHWFYRIVKL